MIKLIKYLLQYRIKDMVDLVKNDNKEPINCFEDLVGKTVVITGATSGIGLEVANLFAKKEARLICINRDPVKSKKLEDDLNSKYNCHIKTIIADFNSLEEVRSCGKVLLNLSEPIDVIVHNSGIYNTRKKYSEDNIEMVFQVNHLCSFLLNFMLMEKLRDENRARIIYVNSEGHRFALSGVHINDLDWKWHFYSGLKSYGASKTAQLLTMEKFRSFFSDSKVTINAMHPGNVKSNIGNNNGRIYRYIKGKLVLSTAKEPYISAMALYYLAASKEVENISGKFFNLTAMEKPAPHGCDMSSVEPLWKKSMELCGLL